MSKTESPDATFGTIRWSPRFSVGVAALDDQHKQLIDMINDVIARSASKTDRKAFAEVLNDMVEYAGVHFQDEEALLKKHGYPACSEQEDLHLEFSEQIVDLSQAYRKDRESAETDLLLFLKRWFFDHILIEDMKYKEFLRDKGVR